MFKLFILILAVTVPYIVSGTCPRIISRQEWGARSPKYVKNLRTNPPPYVVVHHSETPSCNTEETCTSRVKNIQIYHMDHNGWEDIGYNFLIGGNGQIYEGRGWGIHGAHAPKYNARSIGICLIGSYQQNVPPTAQLDALKSLIDCAESSGKVTSNYHLIGHRQASSTECPGNNLFNIIKTWNHFDSNPS